MMYRYYFLLSFLVLPFASSLNSYNKSSISSRLCTECTVYFCNYTCLCSIPHASIYASSIPHLFVHPIQNQSLAITGCDLLSCNAAVVSPPIVPAMDRWD
mmetsp:Transcript_45690/g.46282  ORF Transcript_45690/g.46282 Transcript_45690/m.46282 type:complete len:100 (-) Transcript_45690:422-721(-)